MAYNLPGLPYDADALEPHMSKKTVLLHYGKHHQGYVDKLNGAVKGSDLEKQPLEAIIQAAHEKSDAFLFNNAAQVWNHNFFWTSMTPERTEPTDELKSAIDKSFDGLDGFKAAFKKAATEQFGSGWVWLAATQEGLTIMKTANADLPLIHGVTPLVCCDVWEHAYYLDYQNERGKFVDAFLSELINWPFVAENWRKYQP